MRVITAGKKKIGAGSAVFMVAEISGNHNHDIRRAMKIIDAAAKAGADAVKLQTYTPDTITIDSKRPEFIVKTGKGWKGKTLYELYSEAYTPWKWHARLFAHAKKRGLLCFSSPFDVSAVDFLEKLKTPIYKVSSFEIIDTPLLERIGKTKKPVIISRGMATIKEIQNAIRTLRKFGTKDIVLLQCVSAYPTEARDMHLKTIPDMAKRFKTIVGLSDHSLDNAPAIASVALGASLIEKHLTLRRADGGPDSSFSLEPKEFESLVQSVRRVERALGAPSYKRTRAEVLNIVFRKSLFIVKDIRKGEKFTKANVRSIRPGNGIAPTHYRTVLGKRASRDIKRATPLSWRMIQS